MMNERIRELATQADLFHILPNGNHYPTAMIAEQSIAAYQKFAQLIVQECVDKIAGVPNAYDDYRDQIENAMREYCIYSIKQHFGVES